MEIWDQLDREEQISLELRQLFAGWDFRRTQVTEFEEYDFLLSHRGFITTQNIITFMDGSGRSLALRPDVTLSIVRNVPGESKDFAEKVYYQENVYRYSRDNREYYRLGQIGVESIGGDLDYADIEVIALAMESLRRIDDQYILVLSHMGFVSGLVASLQLPPQVEGQVYTLLHQKNKHDLARLLAAENVPEVAANRLLSLWNLGGSVDSFLEKARELVVSPAMSAALNKLEAILSGLAKAGFSKEELGRLQIDCSAVSDLNYYSDLIFSGYVKNSPFAVLSGGRYDKLMLALGKEVGATGFAISLDGLSAKEKNEKPLDVILFYDAESDPGVVFGLVSGARQEGKRVRAEKAENRPEMAPCLAEIWTLEKNQLEKEGRHVAYSPS